MRRSACVVVAVVTVLGGAGADGRSAAAADAGPVIVVPGRLGMPVIIDGVDVSGAIIEGEFGLNKPHMVAPRVVAAPYWRPPRAWFEEPYFPTTGREPGYGRYEIEPPANRALPPPAPSYHRSWSSQSAPTPPSFDPPNPPPPIVVQTSIGSRRPRNKPKPAAAPAAP